jgi:hypothetical protein
MDKDADKGTLAEDAGDAALKTCPACGTTARRTGARFCATCGRELASDEFYFPSDSLRASYHLQSRRASVQLAGRIRPVHVSARPSLRVMPLNKNQNGASTTALAFATYALVPYLGILFCPGALVMGGVGLLRVRRNPQLGGGRASVVSIALGIVILGAQIFLWWVLYKIPEWAAISY